MIVATPLALQPLVPSDWDKWWEIWHANAAQIKKTKSTHNREGLHFGFDLYKNDKYPTVYEAAKVDFKRQWPEFYEQAMTTLIPLDPYVIRFAMSQGDFPPHSDYRFPNWQVRSMFYHPDPEPQWYFTNLEETTRQDLRLPEQTNWFAYLDGACKHATRYVADKPKIIVQVFSQLILTKKFVDSQLGTFPNFEIHV